jgi:hypothetical protein
MDLAVDTEKMFLLSEFTYDFEKSNAQTFNVLDSTGSGIVDTVRLDFNILFHMYDTIFVYSLRVGKLCVYDIFLETLFYMYGIIFVNSLRDGTLCVYDIVLDTLFHMYEPHWLTLYDVVHFVFMVSF